MQEVKSAHTTVDNYDNNLAEGLFWVTIKQSLHSETLQSPNKAQKLPHGGIKQYQSAKKYSFNTSNQ